MIENNELYIDDKVRIRILEKIAENIDNRFDRIEIEMKLDKYQLMNKMNTHFYWMLGTTITLIIAIITLFSGVVLHMTNLI